MRMTLIAAACLALAACSDPVPDTPPEPQASQEPAGATELRDAIQEPIDKAKAVKAAQEADEAERQKALQDAGG